MAHTTLSMVLVRREIYIFRILLTCSLNIYWVVRGLKPFKKTSVKGVQNHTVKSKSFMNKKQFINIERDIAYHRNFFVSMSEVFWSIWKLIHFWASWWVYLLLFLLSFLWFVSLQYFLAPFICEIPIWFLSSFVTVG